MTLPISKESDEIEIDRLLGEFQRACERVVVQGDSNLSATTKGRAIIRNAIRDRLLDGLPSPVSIERDGSDNATSVTREDVEAVEEAVGMAADAWDMVKPEEIVKAAQTRQLRTTGATWALGVVMARLSIAETERIMASLPEPDLDRFAIAIEPLASDIARARSLSQPIEREVGSDARQDEPDAKLLTDSYEFTSDKGVPFPMSGRDVLQALRSGSGNLRWPHPPTDSESDVGAEAKQEAAPYTIAETYSYGDHRPFCGRCEAKRILRKLFWRGNAGWKCPECDPSAPSSSVSADEIEPAVLHSVHCRKYAIHTAFCDCVPGWQQTAARFEKERDKWRDLANRWIKAAMYATPIEPALAFDPTNPEAFGESRRVALDSLLARVEQSSFSVSDTLTATDGYSNAAPSVQQEIHSLLIAGRTAWRDLKGIFEGDIASGKLTPDERRITKQCVENADVTLSRLDAAIALAEARLQEPPTTPTDTERLDLLAKHVIDVRKPLRFGSERVFVKGPHEPKEGDEDVQPWDIRAAIDKALSASRSSGGAK